MSPWFYWDCVVKGRACAYFQYVNKGSVQIRWYLYECRPRHLRIAVHRCILLAMMYVPLPRPTLPHSLYLVFVETWRPTRKLWQATDKSHSAGSHCWAMGYLSGEYQLFQAPSRPQALYPLYTLGTARHQHPNSQIFTFLNCHWKTSKGAIM